MEEVSLQELCDMAMKLRIHSIDATNASKSGHPTSCASMAEIISCLFFHTMRYKVSNPKDPSNDRFILSKGHAAPILYAAWAEAGLFPVSELLNLRKIDSYLEGHPTPRLNFIDVGTGSLGQGLSVGCGMAYNGKYFDKASYRVYVLIGDGESAEGSIWEALNFASYYKLDNLCAIFDINRLGQSEATCLQHDMEIYRRRMESFGWNALVVDGHDIGEICKAFAEAANMKGKPTAILAKTWKGRNFPGIENADNWHGKPLGDKAPAVITYLRGLISNNSPHKLNIRSPVEDAPKVSIMNLKLSSQPSYIKGKDNIATRFAYGTALTKLASCCERVVALDGDTKNSTYSEKIKTVSSRQYIECFIAEQNLVGVAMGITCRDRTVAFVSTFATFFTRAFDQIRMGAISQTNVNFVGSHCGVSIGEDGPSQMGLEDMALFRSVPGATVFYPSDAVSCEKAVELAANTKNICYIRTSRPNTPIIYENEQKFEIGKGHVINLVSNAKALIIGAGITLHESLSAANKLAEMNISVRVFDPFTIKPLDVTNILENAKQCGGNIVVVEDHYPEGGIGEAVSSALSMETGLKIKRLAVQEVPRSGPPKDLIHRYGISSDHIVIAVKEMVSS